MKNAPTFRVGDSFQESAARPQAFGLRQSSAAFEWNARAKAPEGGARQKASAPCVVLLLCSLLSKPPCLRVSAVQKHDFAKRTQIENHKALQINWMLKIGLASFPKRTHFPREPAIQALSVQGFPRPFKACHVSRRRFKGIQPHSRVLGKNYLFFMSGTCHPAWPVKRGQAPVKGSQARSSSVKQFGGKKRLFIFWEGMAHSEQTHVARTLPWPMPPAGRVPRRPKPLQGVPSRSKAFSRKKRLFIFSGSAQPNIAAILTTTAK